MVFFIPKIIIRLITYVREIVFENFNIFNSIKLVVNDNNSNAFLMKCNYVYVVSLG